MLNLSVFSQNHHLSWVNLMEKYSRRGIWVQLNYSLVILPEESLLQGVFARSFTPPSSFPNCELFLSLRVDPPHCDYPTRKSGRNHEFC